MGNTYIGLSWLLFLFIKSEFDSKSNSVEEGLLRYRNFWPAFFIQKGIYIRNSCLLFFSTISGLPFSFKNQFDFKSNFVEAILKRLGISGLPFLFRKFQFDSKSNFDEQNLQRLGIFGLLISFRMFQFNSKSNSVGESLQRYRNFWAAFFIQKVSIWFQIEFRWEILRRYRNF